MNDIPPFILLVICGLATARITSLIVHDDILEWARHQVFLRSPPIEDPELEMYGGPPGFFGRLVSCTHCMGVWVAFGVYLAAHFQLLYSLPVLTVAALAQISEATIKASR